jgi:beta-xylosidase
MHECLSHYIGCSDPPYDFDLWGNLIYKLGAHLVERYGEEELGNKWAFEVWNVRHDCPLCALVE